MTTIQDAERGNLRERIAANVRAELARVKMPASRLPDKIGKSQSYWSRRVNGDLPFDTDDLYALAELLNVDIRVFLEVDDDRSAGRIYFHGNESSHTGEPARVTESPRVPALAYEMAS